MEKRDCFGSVHEVVIKGDLMMTQTRAECRECEDMRACLSYVKEEGELRRQNMIGQILDLSRIVSNEMGSCLLEALSRVYGSALGMALFKNLFVFYEVPEKSVSLTLTIPVSSSLIELIRGNNQEGGAGTASDNPSQGPSKDGFVLRVVLIQRHFPGNRKANMGLIAYEVARLFSSDDHGIRQIADVLAEDGLKKFMNMDPKARTRWLMEMWGFRDEMAAFRSEMAGLGSAI